MYSYRHTVDRERYPRQACSPLILIATREPPSTNQMASPTDIVLTVATLADAAHAQVRSAAAAERCLVPGAPAHTLLVTSPLTPYSPQGSMGSSILLSSSHTGLAIKLRPRNLVSE